MTNQQQPYQPPVVAGTPTQPPSGGWMPPPPPKRRGLLLWLIGATTVAFLAIGALAFALTGGSDKPAASPATTAPLPQDKCGGGICSTTEPAVEDTTPRVTYTPKTDDFALVPKVTEKHCFGSAGCNVTFRPDLTYSGTLALDEGVTWLVVYEVDGIEDGPQVGNLTIEGTTVSYNDEIVSTKSSRSKITIKVTSVEQQQ